MSKLLSLFSTSFQFFQLLLRPGHQKHTKHSSLSICIYSVTYKKNQTPLPTAFPVIPSLWHTQSLQHCTHKHQGKISTGCCWVLVTTSHRTYLWLPGTCGLTQCHPEVHLTSNSSCHSFLGLWLLLDIIAFVLNHFWVTEALLQASRVLCSKHTLFFSVESTCFGGSYGFLVLYNWISLYSASFNKTVVKAMIRNIPVIT